MTWVSHPAGVQFLSGVKAGYQVAVEERDGWAEVRVLWSDLGLLEREQLDTLAEARAWGESRARLLGLVAPGTSTAAPPRRAER